VTAKQQTAEIAAVMTSLGKAARRVAARLATTTGEERNAALQTAARLLREQSAAIIEANDRDMAAARERGLSSAMLDRLMLDEPRVESMASGMEAISELHDPVGRVLDEWQRPNGLRIQRVAVPLGVIGIIYESRPNVTADAAALCIKSGNAVILRGGSESFHSSNAIYECLREALVATGLPGEAVQMVPTTDRAAVGFLFVYLHAAADPQMARDVVLNAKMRRTGICGAAETVLVDRVRADVLLPTVCDALADAGCEIRGDEQVRSFVPQAKVATEEDWSTEYLDAVISIRVVESIDEAIDHIRRYGSGHTESIVTSDADAAARFFREVDSAIVLHNASTQFADGGEFGMGAEIGIATGRIHARGPVGADQLTSYKYVVHGSGQVRPG
jgi:glutamate-5-semialdehyde dehydrogenase